MSRERRWADIFGCEGTLNDHWVRVDAAAGSEFVDQSEYEAFARWSFNVLDEARMTGVEIDPRAVTPSVGSNQSPESSIPHATPHTRLLQDMLAAQSMS